MTILSAAALQQDPAGMALLAGVLRPNGDHGLKSRSKEAEELFALRREVEATLREISSILESFDRDYAAHAAHPGMCATA